MRSVLSLILLSLVVASNAQTYFYKLSAVVENGNRSAGDGTGLFITFIDGGCYDSDSEGCSMNHGLLNLHYKGVDRILYKGKSYWGNAEYILSGDYELLNVRVGDCVYIYKKSSSPSQRVSTYYGTKASESNDFIVLDGVSDFNNTGEIGNEEYCGKLSPEQYREHYARWEEQARLCYESLVDIVNANDGDELHVNKYKADDSVYHQSEMRKLLIRLQGDMRRVRSEAASYGVNITQSYWETCSPPSRY